MALFIRSSHLPVSVEEAFAWHERSGALERMLPYWERIEVLERHGSIFNNDSLSLKLKMGLLSFIISVRHQNYIQNEQFEDVQVKGPFAHWKHTHLFQKSGDGKSKLIDHIEYALPAQFFSRILSSTVVEEKLDKLFAYRHRTLINDLFLHSRYSKKKLKILVTGGSGFVGKELIPFLKSGGHTVIRLSRKMDKAFEKECVVWNETSGSVQNAELLENLDAVVHLAGENIAAKKWTAERKHQLMTSRVDFTQKLCRMLKNLAHPPKVMVAASGIGIFGNRSHDEILTEESKPGDGFIAQLAREWEAATKELALANTRIVHLRFGSIMSPAGGVLQKLLTPFKLCAGGPIGSGKQMMPWISMVDVLGLILFSLTNRNVTGPVNAVSPSAINNEQFSEVLAKTLNRPNAIRLPEIVVETLFGEMGRELLLSGQHAKPAQALKFGYEFLHTELHDALTYYLGV